MVDKVNNNLFENNALGAFDLGQNSNVLPFNNFRGVLHISDEPALAKEYTTPGLRGL